MLARPLHHRGSWRHTAHCRRGLTPTPSRSSTLRDTWPAAGVLERTLRHHRLPRRSGWAANPNPNQRARVHDDVEALERPLVIARVADALLDDAAQVRRIHGHEVDLRGARRARERPL